MASVAYRAAELAALLTGLGILQCLAGLFATLYFTTRPALAAARPCPVTLLRPLCGDEPLLEESLAACCRQDWADYQIVFGVQDRSDPALAVVARVRAQFPQADITLVIDPALHGCNRKISNLINMLPHARHDTLVFSDSDVHVGVDYLARLVARLQVAGTGLVSTLYIGLPAAGGWWQRLASTQITHVFLPGVLLARVFGRQDCLGNTMILTRETLARAGGLMRLAQEVADDNLLGRRVRALGLGVGLADLVTAVTVPEASAAAMWRHEMRWARTIAAVAPNASAASALQYPIFWALMAAALSGLAPAALELLAAAWVVRGAMALASERLLRGRLSRAATPAPWWMLPARDVLSIAELVASRVGNDVVWRGQVVSLGKQGQGALPPGPPLRGEPLRTRM